LNKNNSNHRLLLTSLTLVLVLGISTSQAFAQSTNGGIPANPDDLVVAQQVVIVAINTSNGFGTAFLGTHIADLEAEGFVVRTVNISNGIPDCVVKLEIAGSNGGGCVGGTFNQAEIDIITDWVNDGGALALFNEVFDCGGMDPIAAAFGETANNDGNTETYTANTHWNPANPATLFDGVTDWFYAFGITHQSSPDAVVTRDTPFPGDQPVMIVKEVGLGCVLMTGDGDWIQDEGGLGIGAADNAILAVNVFQFLNECIAPDVVGGEFLPIDSAALLLAGAQTNAVWIMSALAVIGSIAFGALYITSKKN